MNNYVQFELILEPVLQKCVTDRHNWHVEREYTKWRPLYTEAWQHGAGYNKNPDITYDPLLTTLYPSFFWLRPHKVTNRQTAAPVFMVT